MPTPPKPAANKLDLKQLSDLAKWLESTGLEEVEVEVAGTRMRLRKPTAGFVGSAPAYAAPAAALPPVAASHPAEDSANTLKSPMVGTFYRAASPDAQPFVKEGDSVTTGQPLGIIEAMKTMNQIESDRTGTIRKIMVSNAQAVEFGQPLFVIV